MSDFFLNLARAAVEPGATLTPRLASRFESPAPFESVEVRSAEPATENHPARSARRQSEALPVAAPPALEERTAVARTVASPVVESPVKATHGRRAQSSPPPAAEGHESALEPLDEAAPLRPREAHGEPEVAVAIAVKPSSVVLDSEPGDVTPTQPIGLLPRTTSPLPPRRLEAALVPSAPVGPMPTMRLQAAAPAAEPTVHVTIGRIEIRAVQASPEASASRAAKPTGIMSLDEYVERRRGGRG